MSSLIHRRLYATKVVRNRASTSVWFEYAECGHRTVTRYRTLPHRDPVGYWGRDNGGCSTRFPCPTCHPEAYARARRMRWPRSHNVAGVSYPDHVGPLPH